MNEELQKEIDDKLYKAVKDNNAVLAEEMLEQGANPNTGEPQPLIWAAFNQSFSMVKLLLDAGADRTFRDSKNNKSAADYARDKENPQLVRAILHYIPKNEEQVLLRQPAGNRVLEEIYDFRALERITYVRLGRYAPVEAVTRERFESVADVSKLREAFDKYRRRGGTRPEGDVFPGMLSKKAAVSLKRAGP